MFDNYIDFNEASKEWIKNKRKIKNGTYEYICNYIDKNGQTCKNKNYYCKKHLQPKYWLCAEKT